VSEPWDPRRVESGAPLPPNLDPRRGQPRRPDPERYSVADAYYQPQPAYPPAGPPPRRGGNGAGGAHPGRRRAALATKIIAGLASAAVLIASGWSWLLFRQFNTTVNRVNAITDTTGPDVDGTDQNILLVGNDSRGGLTDAQLKAIGTETEAGFNTDTILLVHVPADGSKATAVSFSRDLNVFIPALGREGKINSAYANGACPDNNCAAQLTPQQQQAGAQALVNTVTRFSGLKIDHYVEVGLLGFYNITEALDGVEICLKKPAKDDFSAINLPAGRQTIRGKQALAFVRQRHGLPQGAFSRIQRQQYFLGAVFRKLTSAGTLVDPLKQQRLVKAVAGSLTMDPKLNPLDLARQLQNLSAGNLTFTTVPVTGTGTNARGQSVDLPDTAALPAFWAKVVGKSTTTPKRTTPAGPTVPRGQVKVTVLNGTGTKGLASQTTTQLANLGFDTAPSGNAARVTQTVIRYGAGQDAAARTLAAVVPNAQLKSDDSVSTVTLVLGTDFTGLATGSNASGGSGGGAASTPATPGKTTTTQPIPPRTAAQDDCID
jgi:LCP family protein required for cell wall assembly